MSKRTILKACAQLLLAFLGGAPALAQRAGDEIDPSQDFRQRDSVYFVPDRVTQFDPASGAGLIKWDRYSLASNLSLNKIDAAFIRARSNEFPTAKNDRYPTLPFSISFLSPG